MRTQEQLLRAAPRRTRVDEADFDTVRLMALLALSEGFSYWGLFRRRHQLVIEDWCASVGEERIVWRGMGNAEPQSAGWDLARLGKVSRLEMLAEYAQERVFGRWDTRRGFAAVYNAGLMYIPSTAVVHEFEPAALRDVGESGRLVVPTVGRRVA